MLPAPRIHRFAPVCSLLVNAAMVVGSAISLAQPREAGAQSMPRQLPPVIVQGAPAPQQGSLNLDSEASVGSRLGMSVRDTPASVAIIPRETFLERGDNVPALAVSRSVGFAPVGMTAFAGSALAARGFTGNNSVAQLYDGQRMFVSGGAMSFPVDTWPFERIEVLSGPASVLYGTGAIGGVVNYVPREIRRDRSQYELFGSVGSWQTLRAGAAATGPLGSNAAYRLNVAGNTSDGYVDRNTTENWVASSALTIDLRSDLKLTLMYDGSDQNDQGYFGTPLIGGRIEPRTRRMNYDVTDASTRFRNEWVRANMAWQAAPGVAVRSEVYRLTTNRDFRNLENYTFNRLTSRIDRTFNFGTDIDQTQYGNRTEVSIDGTLAGRPNRFVSGLEVNRVDFQTSNVTVNTPRVVDPFVFDPGLFNQAGGVRPTLGTATSLLAVFAENALQFTPALTVITGVRTERIDLHRHDKIAGTAIEYDFSPTSWRLGAVYALSPATSIYGQAVTGNDAAGSLISLPAANAAKLQTGRQFEVGLKQQFLGGRGDWTVAVYEIERKNLVSRDSFTPAVTQQIGRQSSRGIEVAMAARPLPRLTIDANATTLRAEFDDFNELVSGVVVSRSGNRPANTPEVLANVFATWRLAGDWQVGGGGRYVGRRFSNNANTLEIPSYVVGDAFLSWRATPRSTVTFRVRNLFDREWVTAPYNGGAQWALGDPRAFEVSGRIGF